MAEPDLPLPLAPVDLLELSLQQDLGALADEPFCLANATQMDDETKLQLLGPQDESHLPSIFGLRDCESFTQLEDKSNSAFADDESEAEQMHLYHEMEDYIVVPSLLLDLIPLQYGWEGHQGRRKCRKRRSCWANAESNSKVQCGWGHHGPRKCRKKSTSCWAERSHLFDLLKRSACRGTTFEGRKNIKRWTSDEAKNLVEGVWIFGVGNWTTVKRVYFKTSFRRPVDLKDKWRDFVRACGVKVGSKKEVKAQQATQNIIEGLEEKILTVYRKHATQRRAP